jgi:hypothetical protein
MTDLRLQPYKILDIVPDSTQREPEHILTALAKSRNSRSY